MRSFILFAFVLLGTCNITFAQVLYASATEVGGRFNTGIGQSGTPKIAFDDVSIANSLFHSTDSIAITKVKVGIRRTPGAPATDVNIYYTPYNDTSTVLNTYISAQPVLIGKVSLPANNASLSTTIVSIGDSISALFKINPKPGNLLPGYQTIFIGTALSNPDPGNAIRLTTGPAQNLNNVWIYNADSTVQTCSGTFDNYVATYYIQVFGNQSTLMPVTYLSFKAEQKEEGANLLSWTTETSLNNTGFEVQRSINGMDYKDVWFVESKTTTSTNVSQSYNYLDVTAAAGQTNYYRLKQTDIDGHFSYSQVVVVKNEKQGLAAANKVFPNPAKALINFKLSSTANEKVSIVVSDLTGRVVISQSEKAVVGDNNFSINIFRLSAGTYSVKAVKENGAASLSYKFLKQ